MTGGLSLGVSYVAEPTFLIALLRMSKARLKALACSGGKYCVNV